MKTVKLITCNDAMKAHILQGALENEGIESILHNENFSTLYKSCVSSIAGVDILVADEDYEKAVQVLRQNQSWPEELTLCPYCGSSDIKFVRTQTACCWRGCTFHAGSGASGGQSLGIYLPAVSSDF